MQQALKGSTCGRRARRRRSRPRLMLGLVVLALSAAGCGQTAVHPNSTELPQRNGDILFSPEDHPLYLMRPDGTQQRPIAGSPRDVSVASWSPDGRRIVFARWRGGSCPVELYVMRADGTRIRRLTERDPDPVMPSTCYGRLAWSPDGRRIVFTKTGGGGWAVIWVMNIDGSGARQLTHRDENDDGDDTDPAWSPDGSTIAFSRGPATAPTLWLMDADGTNQHQLDIASPGCGGGQEPDWSPEGEWIAFARSCARSVGGKKKYWSDIWLIRPDGTDLRRLTDARASSDTNKSPAWSPDGKRIVFESLVSRSRYEDDDIYVMNADGTGQKRLVRLLSYTIAPDWGAR